MEKQLQECMEKYPSHKLPSSYLDYFTESYKQHASPKKEKRKGNPKKIAKSAPEIHDNDETVNSTAAPTKAKRKASTKSSQTDHHIHFREMDTDLVLLLKVSTKHH